jgi:hypothetical protein
MLRKSRCLLSLSAATLVALAAPTVFAQDIAPSPGAQPAPAPASPPPATAPASGETYTETTTQRTVSAPRPQPAANTSTTVNVDADDDARTEPNRYVDSDAEYVYPNRRMLGGAAALLTVSYLPSVIVAAAGDRVGDDNLYYPVVGPWLYMARHEHDAGSKTLLAIDGVLQDLGALEFLLSFVVPQREERRWYELGKNDVRIMPTVSHYNAGLMAGGRF